MNTPNTKHTPGPWTTEKRVTTEITIRAADKTVIAGARCDSYLPAYESEANARLIAAAPELLDALETMTGYAEKLLEAAGSIDGLVDSRLNAEYDIEQARAALAKAS